MNKYNLRSIMSAAWRFFRKGAASFSLALRSLGKRKSPPRLTGGCGSGRRDPHLGRMEASGL